MRRVALITVVVVVLALVGLRACQSRSGQDNVSPTPTAAPAADTATGPRGVVHGVPVGWGHDATGARAAAVSALELTGVIAQAGFITRGDMLNTLATDRFGPTLTRDSNAQLDELLGDLAEEGITPASVLFRELALTAQVVSVDATAASVEVWSLLIVGLPDGAAPRQLWRTVTVELLWERDDWRVDGWVARPGPAPALAANTSIATVAEVTDVLAWGPARGGDR
ncbi:MAG TPA: hypothetical protein VNQ73_02455 [Ilumatobacter sp.]|nr:hypothetical protein [Ilumatobacter sp.]